MPERVVVLGLPDPLAAPVAQAVAEADLVVGGTRHLDALGVEPARRCPVAGDVDSVLDAVEACPGVVAVVASGDPGFFGMVRPLAARLGRERLEVHPAPSSVSLAFARLGLHWDDAAVVSAHGRPLDAAARAAARLPKVAVLTSPDNPPQAVAAALLAAGARHRTAAVCSRLGLDGESVVPGTLEEIAGGCHDPLSVLVCVDDEPEPGPRSLAWGLPDGAFEHRAGMLTKSEVRAVALGKLDLPARGVLWDVGSGSGSVAVEAARLAPGLRVIAVERRSDDCDRIRANAAAWDVAVDVVEGEAPACLERLPDPDRVFVGGGGLEVLHAALARLRPGGAVVATFAALDRAAAAAAVLGDVVQVIANRGERLPDGSFRLVAANPVFVAWGPVR